MTRRLAVTVMIGAVVLGAVGCFSVRPVFVTGTTNDTTDRLGSIDVSSPRLGQLTVVPTDCQSGARQFFLGGDFIDEKTGLVVRLVVDPISTPAIKVFAASDPFGSNVVFRREECSTFHFSLDSTGWRINHIEDYRMTLDIDCSRLGELVRGTASTTHCH